MPAEVTIVEVDPHDDDLFARFHAAHRSAHVLGREQTATVWPEPELKVLLGSATQYKWRQAYAALRDGRVVGTGLLVTSLVDNLDAAEIEVDVVPDLRGQGIGTALLAHLEAVCRERGRHILQSEVAWPYDAALDGAGVRDVEFAARRGYALGIVDIQRQLALPVDPGLLDRLAADAAPHHAAYEIRAWSGDVPDDLVEGWARLCGSLMTEAPTGDMDREVEAIDTAGIREGEATARAQGRTKYNAVAVAADGSVVAYTDIATTVHEPGRSFQWGTLVHRDHRGRRLGLAVKVANLQQLAAERPDITTIRTWNAEVNAHMVGVNELLGFRPVERMGEFQKKLT